MVDYLGLCLAFERIAPTQYQNYNFNSMCKFKDAYLGANTEGIFVMDSGDKDGTDNIEAFFEIVTSDWGIPNPKRIRKMYVSLEANGDLMLTVYDDEENQRTFNLEPIHLNNKQHVATVGIGRDGKGTHWMVRIDNVNGSDFSIDRIQAVPVILGKKPSGT